MRILVYILLIVMSATELKIYLQPKQKELKEAIEFAEYDWIGFGGARGGAKSHAIQDLAILFGLKYKTYSLLFRRYYNELLDNHINPIMTRHPYLRKFYNKADRILYHPDGEPILRFGYAEAESDIYKFQGISYPLIFVDEATQSTQEMMEWLQSSNRDPMGLLPSKAKMILTMNPGGVGHTYIKRLFIDKVYSTNEMGYKYYFIQAHVWDNAVWSLKKLEEQGLSVQDYYNKWTEQQRIDFTMNNSDYAKRLAGLPDHLKLAYLYGDWNVFGGMFFKGFDATKQVVDPFPIPERWYVNASLDPGFASPLSFGIQARDFKGNIYRIGTYYGVDKIETHAKNVKLFLEDENSPIYPYLKGRKPKHIVAGRDAFSKLDANAIKSNEGTVRDLFRREGLTLLRGNDGPNTRLENWWKWKGLIPDKYFVFRGLNTNLLEQITSMESDPKNPEDILGRGNDATVEDHALDEQKLGIFAMFKPTEEEETKPVGRPSFRQTNRILGRVRF